MSGKVHVADASFELSRSAEAKALLKLGFDQPSDLELALTTGGWTLERRRDRAVDDIDYTGPELLPEFNAVLPQLGPFVTSGSYIVLEDEDGAQCRWDFDGRVCTFLDFGLLSRLEGSDPDA
jgi:hypothetical protein